MDFLLLSAVIVKLVVVFVRAYSPATPPSSQRVGTKGGGMRGAPVSRDWLRGRLIRWLAVIATTAPPIDFAFNVGWGGAARDLGVPPPSGSSSRPSSSITKTWAGPQVSLIADLWFIQSSIFVLNLKKKK